MGSQLRLVRGTPTVNMKIGHAIIGLFAASWLIICAIHEDTAQRIPFPNQFIPPPRIIDGCGIETESQIEEIQLKARERTKKTSERCQMRTAEVGCLSLQSDSRRLLVLGIGMSASSSRLGPINDLVVVLHVGLL